MCSARPAWPCKERRRMDERGDGRAGAGPVLSAAPNPEPCRRLTGGDAQELLAVHLQLLEERLCIVQVRERRVRRRDIPEAAEGLPALFNVPHQQPVGGGGGPDPLGLP